MSSNRLPLKLPKTETFKIDHNPYEINSYNYEKPHKKVILFPVFHYEGDKQFFALINKLLEQDYQVVTFNFLYKGDRVLFFNYYAKIFTKLYSFAIKNEIIKEKQDVIVMGFGVGALLASYLQKSKIDGIKKMILISPLNRYKDEYSIGHDIKKFKIPTHIFFGQNDKVVSVESRYAMFEKGHLNNNIKFTTYPITGHFLYYKDKQSVEIEENYRANLSDILLGESSKYRTTYIPDEVELNEKFFSDLFLELEDKKFPKRIGLLTDVFPLFTNGVSTVVKLLKEELSKLGYETYIIALWDKNENIKNLPIDYIPVYGSPARFIKGHKDLHLLKSFAFQRNAKMLTTFGFDYLHLHTEYSMSQIALWLAKYTDIKMVYTYHTLWKLYYEQKFGKLIGETVYNAAKELLFNRVYKECPVITVPSVKSYEILKEESESKDIRVIPSSINLDRFKMSKKDNEIVNKLRIKYDLEDKKVLGYVGRVSMEKNIFETLEYISHIRREVSNIVFMIVGVGDAIKPLKKQIKSLGLERSVIFVGQVENEKLKYYYSLFDVFVTASNFETQGLTYFEAATSGTLILAREDKALEGIFVDNKNAYIYKNYDEWHARLAKALYNDNQKIINNAKETMKQYAPERWAKKLLGIYKELND